MKKASCENSEYFEKISRDIPKEHWNLIFQDSHEASNQKSVDSSKKAEEMNNSFYIDEKKYHKNEFYHNNGQSNKHQNYNYKKTEWKSNNYSNATTHHDNHHKNPNEFINKLQMSNVNEFSIDHSYVKVEIKEDISKTEQIITDKKFNSSLFESMCEVTNNPEESYEENPNRTFLTKEKKKTLDEIPILSVDIQTNYNFREVNKQTNFSSIDIKSIFKINEKINYPKNEPLWYIYHIVSKSSFGPVSSFQLEEMYNKKNIDGMSDIRFIDIFKLRNKGCFAYFKLKELTNTNFLIEDIEPTILLKYVDELNNLKKQEIELKLSEKRKEINIPERENNNKKKPKQKYVDFEDIISEPPRNQAIINIEKKQEKNVVKIKEDISIKIKNDKSVIDEELEEINTNKTVNSIQGNIKKKPGKKTKGKPVEIDIKTGFFTLSQQEKEYDPIYICGDSQDKKK